MTDHFSPNPKRHVRNSTGFDVGAKTSPSKKKLINLDEISET